MAKLEQDNKFLADLEKQRKAAKVLNTNITETTSASSTSSTSTNGHSDTNSSSTPSSNNHSPTSLPRFVYIIFGIRRIILIVLYVFLFFTTYVKSTFFLFTLFPGLILPSQIQDF